ncbi:MAG: HD domain-containing protein [Dehalococcoidia bacterium]|nr:HD domain-containing protein [Dehalococcoidia bacterium]
MCGGNTCRSPMAKIILEQMLKENGLGRQFEVDSAAYDGADGTSAHVNSIKTILKRYGADLLADHVPKKLTDEMAEKADLIMVMVERMKGGSLAGHKVVVLGIPDPFNQNEQKYDECADALERRFKQIWTEIVGPVPVLPRTEDVSSVIRPPRTVPTGTVILPTGHKMTMAEQIEAIKIKMKMNGVAADWVHNEILKIALKEDYGRGKHPLTVTRLMLNMYDDMAAIGFINDTADKRKLAEAAGLSHDIGVGKEQGGEDHKAAGFRMLKEQLWDDKRLSAYRKDLLAVVMYSVFYHGNPVPDGKLEPLKDILLEDYRTTAELVSLLRVADGLDYGLDKGTPDMFEKVEMVRTSKGVECRVFPRAGKDVMWLVAKSYEKREVFEGIFGKLTFWLPGASGSWFPWHP